MHTDVRELKLIDPKIIVATLQLRSSFYSFLKSFVYPVHRYVQTSIFACADVSENIVGCDVPLGNHIVWL